MQEVALEPKVRIEQDTLVIESFRTTDSDIVSYFKDKKMDEYERLLETALRAGTIAIRSVSVGEKIDYIKREFSELDNRFSININDKIQQLDQKYEEYFGEKGKISEIINTHFGENGKIVKEIFDPNKDGSPLFTLNQEWKRELSELREKLGIKEQVEEVKARTVLKGYDFEALCQEKLSEIVRQNGDELEKTTDKVGVIPNSKEGDYVVTIGDKDRRRIVFETKDVSKIALPKIHEILEGSIKNRVASYGVFVVKNVEALPQSVGWFNEYSGNQLVCALTTKGSETITNPEILYVAYRWAKTRALLEASNHEKLDVKRVKELVDELKNHLQNFRRIKTQCTTIKKSAKDIKTIADEIEDQIDDRLAELLKSIASKTEPS